MNDVKVIQPPGPKPVTSWEILRPRSDEDKRSDVNNECVEGEDRSEETSTEGNLVVGTRRITIGVPGV